MSGLTTVRVTAGQGDATTLTWGGDLAVHGNLTLYSNETPVEASLEGSVSFRHEEARTDPFVLPLAFEDQGDFDLTISLGVIVPYTASLQLAANVTPTESYPTYPLERETGSSPSRPTWSRSSPSPSSVSKSRTPWRRA